MVSGGADTADFGSFTQNFSGIVNNSPYQNNGSGYWAVLFSGNASGSFGSDMLILDNGTLQSGNGSYSNNTSVLSFGTERGSPNTSPTDYLGNNRRLPRVCLCKLLGTLVTLIKYYGRKN